MFIIYLIIGAFIGIFLMCLVQINRENKECLHCGKGAARYCEKCYQDLISENTRLQLMRVRPVHTDSYSMGNHIPRID